MSVQATRWAVGQRVISGTVKAVLMVMAEGANKDGACFPSHRRLAFDCCMSVDTLQRALAYLAEEGFVTVSARYDEGGRRVSNQYLLNLSRPAANPPADDIDPPAPDPRDPPAPDPKAPPQSHPQYPGNDAPTAPRNVPGSRRTSSLTSSLTSKGPDGLAALAAEQRAAMRDQVWVTDLKAMSAMAGESMAKGRARLAGLTKAAKGDLHLVHKALAETIQAEPAGNPFDYATRVLDTLMHPAREMRAMIETLPPNSQEAMRLQFQAAVEENGGKRYCP